MKISLLAAGVTLLDAIIFGVLAYVMYRKKCAKLAGSQRTWGDVIEVKNRAGRNGTTRHPVIRFTAMDGQTVTFESNFGSSNWKIKAGDRIEVFYNPNKPSGAEPVYFVAQWFLPLVFGIISVSSLIAAPLLYLFLGR